MLRTLKALRFRVEALLLTALMALPRPLQRSLAGRPVVRDGQPRAGR